VTAPADPLAVAAIVTNALERLGIRYSIGGSFASSFAGEPRSTLDVDVVVAMTPLQSDALADALGSEFYFDRDRMRDAAATCGSANLIHSAHAIKVDLFVAGGTPLDLQLLDRRRAVTIGDPPRAFFVHSPEDILLQKLRWFRLGGELSDRQWRDIAGIVRVQGKRLDRAYLVDGAARLGVQDLLQRALSVG